LRNVSKIPDVDYFKPMGIPLADLEAVILSVEELETIKLVDFEGLEHEEAAKKMNVSRKTLWRDLKSGRKKVADALINGKSIEIRGGDFVVRT
jgi:Predicted DNA-binding proteins